MQDIIINLIPIIGVIVGGLITIVVTKMNKKDEQNNQILKERFKVYSKISTIIVTQKIETERTIANIAKLKLEQRESKINEKHAKNNFNKEYDSFIAIRDKIWSLYIYSYILHPKENDAINKLNQYISFMANPQNMLNEDNFNKLSALFEDVLKSINNTLNANSKSDIKIPNPNKTTLDALRK
ncbi:MAG: hypothetical protein L3J43_05345 [Sulfurovum sp.]|nr:hypothetical protein [Sulfurovum sp.]